MTEHTTARRDAAITAPRADLSDVQLLTVQEVATIMRVSKMTVYRMIKQRELGAVKFGATYRVRIEEVRKYL
jgi:excisionase family DNA binding protein